MSAKRASAMPSLTPSSLEDLERAHIRELEAPDWGEDDAPKQARARQPEQLLVRTASDGAVVKGLYRYGRIEYDSFDPDAGLRVYSDTRTVLYGFYGLAGSSMFVGEALDIVVFPADVNEYDGIPELDAALVDAFGCRFAVVSGDRGFFLRPVNEYWLRRRTGVVTPRKTKVGRRKVGSLGGPLFDRDGVPTCQECGSPGNQSHPGLGLRLEDGEPVIDFRCLAQLTPACASTRTIRCKLEYLLLTAPSRLRDSFHSLRERQFNLEHGFRHMRQRFRVGGKELADCLPYPGIAAHQLRIEASLLMLWLRIGIRNGWIAPSLIETDLNPYKPVQLSAQQDRRSLRILEQGIGTPRLNDLLDKREHEGLHVPHGPAFERYLAQ